MAKIIPCPNCGQLNRLDDKRDGKLAHCPACKSPLFTGRPISLHKGNFDRQTGSDDLPVVVDFWALWCGPCRAMAPAFEAAAAAFEPGVRFAKVDTEAEQGLAQKYGIQAIPTLILFKGGRELARRSGAISAGALRQWLEQAGVA